MSRVDAVKDPKVAVIWGLPIARTEAKPDPLIPTRVVSDEVHTTGLLIADMLPSLKTPVAVNCC
jgi:hypothetical protein